MNATRTTTPAHITARGMTLFEVILALALFSSAAVALVITINTIGLAAIEARSLRAIEQGLEGIIDEYSKNPQITETDQEIKAGEDGVSYRVKIKPITDIKSRSGQQLDNLYQVKVIAQWTEDGEKLTMEAETLRYAGMYLPLQQ
jgi:prepilin-type N-terminal cleavage/methylation domain-containing protein